MNDIIDSFLVCIRRNRCYVCGNIDLNKYLITMSTATAVLKTRVLCEFYYRNISVSSYNDNKNTHDYT